MTVHDFIAAKQLMRDKLAQLGIAHEEITVFGAERLNVHIVCVAHDTARRWLTVLNRIFPNGKIACVKHSWPAKQNKGTNLCPTIRDGYLIGVIDK